MIRDLDDPDRMISRKPFALWCRNVLLFHPRDFVPSSCLRRLRACVYSTTFCFLKKFNLRWVLRTLDNNQIIERGVLSSELPEILTSQRQNEFNHIITDKESPFYFEYLHAAVSTPSPDEVSERIKHKTHTEEWLISII
jgi:hypothetical protein